MLSHPKEPSSNTLKQVYLYLYLQNISELLQKHPRELQAEFLRFQNIQNSKRQVSLKIFPINTLLPLDELSAEENAVSDFIHKKATENIVNAKTKQNCISVYFKTLPPVQAAAIFQVLEKESRILLTAQLTRSANTINEIPTELKSQAKILKRKEAALQETRQQLQSAKKNRLRLRSEEVTLESDYSQLKNDYTKLVVAHKQKKISPTRLHTQSLNGLEIHSEFQKNINYALIESKKTITQFINQGRVVLPNQQQPTNFIEASNLRFKEQLENVEKSELIKYLEQVSARISKNIKKHNGDLSRLFNQLPGEYQPAWMLKNVAKDVILNIDELSDAAKEFETAAQQPRYSRDLNLQKEIKKTATNRIRENADFDLFVTLVSALAVSDLFDKKGEVKQELKLFLEKQGISKKDPKFAYYLFSGYLTELAISRICKEVSSLNLDAYQCMLITSTFDQISKDIDNVIINQKFIEEIYNKLLDAVLAGKIKFHPLENSILSFLTHHLRISEARVAELRSKTIDPQKDQETEQNRIKYETQFIALKLIAFNLPNNDILKPQALDLLSETHQRLNENDEEDKIEMLTEGLKTTKMAIITQNRENLKLQRETASDLGNYSWGRNISAIMLCISGTILMGLGGISMSTIIGLPLGIGLGALGAFLFTAGFALAGPSPSMPLAKSSMFASEKTPAPVPVPNVPSFKIQ